MRNIVTYREPRLRPLPPSVQDKMKDAQLPMRLEAARRAVAACTDLSELLDWKDKSAAIAAAAKAARMPDIARDANRICKEALLRLGQLLNEYSDVLNPILSGPGFGKIVGTKRSERTKAAREAGLPKHVANAAHRLALAPKELQDRILEEDRIPPSPHAICRLTPARIAVRRQSLKRSVAYNAIMQGQNEFGRNTRLGLNFILAAAKSVVTCDFRSLAADEKSMVKAKVTEIMELLDAIDQATTPL